MKKTIKILIIIISFFQCLIGVNANTTTYERTENNNYGVNKHWNIDSSNLDNVKNTPLVDANEKIYDFSEILTDNEETILKQKIDSFISKTKMDMVIVTVNLPYSYDKENEIYASDFYDYNDFGIDFEKYSGVLLLRNTYSYDRYYNVYLFGDAQLYYSFNRTENVLDNIYYDISNDYYLNGFSKFINEMSDYYDDGIPNDMTDYEVDEDGYLKQQYVVPIFKVLLIAFIITLIIMIILIRKNKMVKKATKASEYLKKDSINFTRREDIFLTEHTTSRIISSDSSSGSSGGRSSSSRGSSGGGHSSGGGRHG